MVKFLAEIKIAGHFSISIICNEVDKEAVELKIRTVVGTKTVNELLDQWKIEAGDFMEDGFEFTCDGDLIPV